VSTGATAASLLTASILLAAAPLAAAAVQSPATYEVGSIPVAAGTASVEFPILGDFRGEIDVGTLAQGTYTDKDPLEYLSLVTPVAWLHYDGVPNLRLSLAFQELFFRAVVPVGLPDGHEERFITRARLQQPRGGSALYELVQLDVRSFVDPGGTHRIVYQPRFRVGQGFNLDAARIQSLVLYQELALRFSDASYTTRAFSFLRGFVGYTWTTRRGIFVTVGLVGQISLNPPATRYDFWYGPALAFAYRFRPPSAAEAPPTPPDPQLQ
jgi:hypothetical protein